MELAVTHTLGLHVTLGLRAARCHLRRLWISAPGLSSRGRRPAAVRTRTGLVVVLAVLGRAPPPTPPVRHLRARMVGTGSKQRIVGGDVLLRLTLKSNARHIFFSLPPSPGSLI